MAISNLTLAYRIVSTTTSYTVKVDDTVVLVDCTGGNVTISLPAITKELDGKFVYIKRMDNSGNTITVSSLTGATIDGAASLFSFSQYTCYTLLADNTNGNWKII